MRFHILVVFLLVLFVNFFSIRPRKNALFLLDLVIDKDGVHFSTALPSFEQMLVSLFDKGIQATQNVPQLEKVTGFFSLAFFSISFFLFLGYVIVNDKKAL